MLTPHRPQPSDSLTGWGLYLQYKGVDDFMLELSYSRFTGQAMESQPRSTWIHLPPYTQTPPSLREISQPLQGGQQRSHNIWVCILEASEYPNELMNAT